MASSLILRCKLIDRTVLAVSDLRELLNDNDPSVRAEALVALENLAGKGARPAELKSLSAHR
jgi:HEAT repeat protein